MNVKRRGRVSLWQMTLCNLWILLHHQPPLTRTDFLKLFPFKQTKCIIIILSGNHKCFFCDPSTGLLAESVFVFVFFYSLSYSNPISSIMMLKLTLSLGCTSLIFYTYLSEVQRFPGDLYQLCPVHKPWTCFVIQVIMHSWTPGGRYSMMNDSWKLAKCVFDHSGKKGLTATYLHFLKNIGFCWSLTAVLFFP